MVLYAALIIFFCFFYTADRVQSGRHGRQPEEAWRLHSRASGPASARREYIDYVLTRITVLGAIYIAVVCLLPEMHDHLCRRCPSILGGTSLLIVVSVTMDTVAQVQGHLLAHQYEGLIKRSRLKGQQA